MLAVPLLSVCMLLPALSTPLARPLPLAPLAWGAVRLPARLPSPAAARRRSQLRCAAADDATAYADALPRKRVRANREIRGTRMGRRGEGKAEVRPQGRSSAVRELQKLSITGGECRGRRIMTPDIYLRPMMSRVREALFSMVYPTDVLQPSCRHLDLFAGSGVIGLEALSRGMGSTSFVDFSGNCVSAIRANADNLGLLDRAHIIQARVEDVLATPERFGASGVFDLVTLTPPYEEVVYAELVESLATSPLVGEDTLVVIEYPVELGIFPPVLAEGRFVGLRNRRYGRTVLALYVCRPSGRMGLDPFSEEFVSFSKGRR